MRIVDETTAASLVIVTEHGAVDLRGKSLRARAELLVGIASPEDRADLRAAAVARKLFA